MSPDMMPGFLEFPDQPDYMVQTDAFNPNLAKIIMQNWIDGDEDERAEIDRGLAKSWERQKKDQERDHHRMTFGVYPY